MMERLIIGFTGTRSGMSDKQKKEVAAELEELGCNDPDVLYTILHGGCIGADIDFHDMCSLARKEVFPGHSAKDPSDMKHRGEYPRADVIHDSQTHFKRNRDIVDRCDILIATPYNDNQEGGTWYTINYALKKGKDVSIFNRL